MRPHPPRSTLFPYTTLFRSSDSFQESKRLPGPQWVVELIEGDHSALGHPWHERLDGSLRGLVEVAVQKQQADDEVSVVADEARYRFRHLASDQFHLRDVTKE